MLRGLVGGNVCTSQRITDVVLKAFNAAAASQGDCQSESSLRYKVLTVMLITSMALAGNNFTFGQGGQDEKGQHAEGW